MKRIRVTVTQEDIENGVRGSSKLCPMTRAIRREGSYPKASVGLWFWYPISPFDDGTRRLLSRPAFEWRRAFDAGKPVSPATFLLPVPE